MKNLSYVLLFTAMTAISWGVYGPLLSIGGKEMGGSHWLPFVFVGVAYFLIAVLATTALLVWRGEPGNWNSHGILWSFLAGVVTAVGALSLILALTNKGNPIYVMPLVFGGAPVFNTLLAMWISKTYRETGPLFYAGLILVIAGAVAVLVFKPHEMAPPVAPQPAVAEQAAATTQSAATEPTGVTAQPGNKFGLTALLLISAFIGLTAICWGCYGPLLHKGQTFMHGSRMRPFICVGMAYVVVAIVAPLIFWTALGDHGQISARGVLWSLAGGTAGALGSLGVILAFTFGGKPIYVMPLVFGGAPVVNTFISIATAKQLSSISPFFYAGLIVVIAGAVSVLIFAPRGAPAHAASAPPAPAKPAPSPAP
jgi:drug/metabolite transporter (DMT)-like permease